MPTHKYKYPAEFLTKKGTLKKNLNKKKLTEWRNTHNYDGTLITSQKSNSSSSSEDISDSAFRTMHSPLEKHEQKDYLVDRDTTRKHKTKKSLKKKTKPRTSSSSSSSSEALKKEFLDGIEDGNEDGNKDDIEDIGNEVISYSNLSMDIDERILNEYVFDNNGRILTHETCNRLRDYCELNPRRCYLERDFLERYVRICKMIAKTSLYVDAFYDRIIDLNPEYFRMGPRNAQSWRQAIVKERSLYIVIKEQIPKSQMPEDAKKILINIISNIQELSGGIKQLDRGMYYSMGPRFINVFRNNIQDFITVLANNRNLMEIMIQLWREGMATQTTRKPKQIEEIIRRFVKNL